MSVLNDLLHGITPRMRKEMEQARKAELKRKAELRKQEQRITIENSAVSRIIIDEIATHLSRSRIDRVAYVFVSSRRVVVDTRDNWENIGIGESAEADYEFLYKIKGYRMLEDYEPRLLCEWIHKNLKDALLPSHVYSEIEGIHYTRKYPPEYFYRFKINKSIIEECSNSSRLAPW